MLFILTQPSRGFVATVLLRWLKTMSTSQLWYFCFLISYLTIYFNYNYLFFYLLFFLNPFIAVSFVFIFYLFLLTFKYFERSGDTRDKETALPPPPTKNNYLLIIGREILGSVDFWSTEVSVSYPYFRIVVQRLLLTRPGLLLPRFPRPPRVFTQQDRSHRTTIK